MDDLIANLIVIPTQGRLRNWLAAIDGATQLNPGAEKFRCMVGGLEGCDARLCCRAGSELLIREKTTREEGFLLRKQLLGFNCGSVMGCCLYGIGDRNWRCWIVCLNN